MKKIVSLLFVVISHINIYSQTTVTERVTVLDANHNYILTNNLLDETIPSPMTYEPADISTKGAAFETVYHNSDGGSSFDGYQNGAVGHYKKGGTYYPGNFTACGMPAQIQNIDTNFRIKWMPYQLGVDGPNDQWWASINVIFDNGAKNDEPEAADRDYDLVIEFQRYEEYDFVDKPKKTGAGEGGSYNWICRDGFVDDGNGNNIAPIHPFEVVLEGITYQFGVRYKFFNYPAGSSQKKLDKNNKVHIKFIPLDNANVIPFLDHPLKSWIDVTKTYYSLYIDGLPAAEKALADQKVGLDALWVKQIAAGYEVYKDAGNNNGNDPNNGITLGQHFFLTITDDNAPSVPSNLTIAGTPTSIDLTWDASTDMESVNTSIAMYKIYRSVDGGAYTLLSDAIYQENYTDNTALNGVLYSYYVTAEDRSFNESTSSNSVSSSVLSVGEVTLKTFKVYPNPVSNILYISGHTSEIETIELYTILGQKQIILFNKSNQSVNLESLKRGVYFLKIKNQTIKVVKL
jgi:hypothetical protein